MLWQMSRRPGLLLSIFAGVVWILRVSHVGPAEELLSTNLGVLATLEKRRYANEAHVVIPHYSV